MISRRTWCLVAATAMLFVTSFLYREQRPIPDKSAPGGVEVGWDYKELGPTPYEEWIHLGYLCATASGISLLVDFIATRRKRT